MVIEKTSSDAFQALWIELMFEKKRNIICGIVYRQHNSPESFQSYLDEVLERISLNDKTVYIVGDFNINLLNVETCSSLKTSYPLYKATHSFQQLINQLGFTIIRLL